MAQRDLPTASRVDRLVGAAVLLLLATPVVAWFGGWTFLPSEECTSSGYCDFSVRGSLLAGSVFVTALVVAWSIWDRRCERRDAEHQRAVGVLPRALVAPWYSRFWAACLALVPIVPVALVAGTNHYERVHCGGDIDGDCDLGALEGLSWALEGVALWVLAVIAYEVVLWRRRRRDRRTWPARLH